MPTTTGDRTYAKTVGARLRALRVQQGLSLYAVEQKSRGRWKTAAVGSYERGDRMASVATLAELAGFYGAPVEVLLTGGGAAAPRPVGQRAVLDLEKLAAAPEAADLARAWVAQIQNIRGDYNGRVLTVRHGDVGAIGLLYGVPAGQVRAMLDAWGVLGGGREERAEPA